MLSFKLSSKHNGFSLVEIIMVIALIGILASVVLVSLSQAREASKVGKAKEELKNIEQAFKLYRQEQGVMPPGIDSCTLCGWGGFNFAMAPATQLLSQAEWVTVVAHVATTIPSTIPERDPWGTYYAYDNNYRVSGFRRPSIVCSLGPDRTLNTWLSTYASVSVGDDICIFFPEPDDL